LVSVTVVPKDGPKTIAKVESSVTDEPEKFRSSM